MRTAAIFLFVAACSTRGNVDASNSDVAPSYQSSYEAESSGNIIGALEALNALPSPEREAYTAELRRGWLLHRLGRNAEAIAAYRRAAEGEPSSIEARLGLLLPLLATEQWRDLEVAAEDVIDRDPESYVANARLGLALYRQRRFAEAEAVYGKLIVRYPADVDLRAALGWSVFDRGDQASAARVFAEVLRIAPHHPSALEGARASAVGLLP